MTNKKQFKYLKIDNKVFAFNRKNKVTSITSTLSVKLKNIKITMKKVIFDFEL